MSADARGARLYRPLWFAVYCLLFVAYGLMFYGLNVLRRGRATAGCWLVAISGFVFTADAGIEALAGLAATRLAS